MGELERGRRPWRRRLRPAYTHEELGRVYPKPHRHDAFPDHLLRVSTTVATGAWMIRDLAGRSASLADLSTGDAAVPRGIVAASSVDTWHLGDFAWGYEYTGPIEETIDRIPQVDLFVCSETIEHLDDPDAVLRAIRGKARRLVLSTPDGENDTNNPEHYWGWNMPAVREMLEAAGFAPVTWSRVSFTSYEYDYQIWGCA